MTEQTIPTAELDTRIAMFQALIRTPHRDLASLSPLYRAGLDQDPLFAGHLYTYIFDQMKAVRDHRVLAVAHLITSPYGLHREAGWVLLQSLPVFMIRQLVDYCKQTLHKEPRVLKSAVTAALTALEAKGRKFDAVAVRSRDDLKHLYATLHIKPGALAQALLFDEQPARGTKREIIKRIAAETDTDRQAELILEHKIPYTIAVGAVKTLTPAIKVAILANMTGAEVRNHLKALKRWGLMDNADTKQLIEQKIAAGTTDSRVSVGKTDKAIQAAQDAGDEEIVAALRESRDVAIAKGTRIGDESGVALLIDKSSSMSAAIERGIKVATRLAAHADLLYVYTFDGNAFRIELPAKATMSQVEKAFQMVRAGGSTSIGAPVQKMQRDGVRVGMIMIVSDYEETTGATFQSAYGAYATWLGRQPEVVAIGVGQAARYRHVVAAWERVMPARYFDWTDEKNDQYAIDNLVELVAAPDYAQLIDAIMAVELPSRTPVAA